jgi:hypothetical protein
MNSLVGSTHITVIGWILIVILSGLASAILTQLGAALVGILQAQNKKRLQESEQQFKERMQRDEREHQSLQLLIKAHFGQREKSLKDAVDVRDWLWRQSYTLYGSDYDYFGDHEPPANLTEVVDVLSALKRISYFHPTRSVRRKASRLEGSIANHYNSPNGDLTEIGGRS